MCCLTAFGGVFRGQAGFEVMTESVVRLRRICAVATATIADDEERSTLSSTKAGKLVECETSSTILRR